MEMGYSAAVLFNKFLLTGDTSVLNIKVLYTSPNYMEMWKQLYKYNSTLPDENKISIHGVDFEATSSVFSALLLLKSIDKKISAPLTGTFKKIHEYASDTSIHYDTNFFQKVEEIKKAFAQNKELIADLYGDNLKLVNNILNNDIKMNEDRDPKIYAHMRNEITTQKIGKFVVFYGGDHVNYNYHSSVASRFKRNAYFKNKVKTIRMFCFNAYDNQSREILDCIGTYDEKEGRTLKQRYMNKQYRAVLISDFNLKDKMLNHSADYYLFANDK